MHEIAEKPPTENLHMLICKQLLGVHRSTTNIGVLLELGRIPLEIYAVKLAVKNWERIKKNKGNCLILASYSDAVGENAFETIKEENSKLRTYVIFKKNIDPETIVSD